MKIKIHNSTYIFLLLSFLAGYFEYVFLLLIIIFIHESGHYIIGIIEGLKVNKIEIYPFGGITKFDCDLNVSTLRELICLLGGVLFQGLFFILIRKLYLNGFVTLHVFNIIKRINILLISFNFLPILPLDGGRLLNILLDNIFSYKLSIKISLVISFIFIIIFVLYNKTIYSVILSLFLIKCIVFEYKNINYKYQLFLFERYKNNYNFKKIKIINSINKLKRDNKHIINNKFENDYLNNMFDNTY